MSVKQKLISDKSLHFDLLSCPLRVHTIRDSRIFLKSFKSQEFGNFDFLIPHLDICLVFFSFYFFYIFFLCQIIDFSVLKNILVIQYRAFEKNIQVSPIISPLE